MPSTEKLPDFRWIQVDDNKVSEFLATTPTLFRAAAIPETTLITASDAPKTGDLGFFLFLKDPLENIQVGF